MEDARRAADRMAGGRLGALAMMVAEPDDLRAGRCRGLVRTRCPGARCWLAFGRVSAGQVVSPRRAGARTVRRKAGSSHGRGPAMTSLRVAMARALLTRPNSIMLRVAGSNRTVASAP